MVPFFVPFFAICAENAHVAAILDTKISRFSAICDTKTITKFIP